MRKNYKLLGAVAVAISTYATSAVQYNASTTNSENLDSVQFTLDKTARYVAMRTKNVGTWVRSDDLRPGTSTINSCTSDGGLGILWTCDVTGNSETVVDANNLSVVATS